MPQPPQLSGLLTVSTSQPSVSLLLLQSENPAAQAPLHTPAAQLGVGRWLDEQASLQAPQCTGSVWRLTSQPSSAFPSCGPLQSSKFVAQVGTHWPFVQVELDAFSAEHAPPQDPQCEVLVCKLVSQPFAAGSQSPKPVSQEAIWHAPVAQVAVACAWLQAWPQPPQLSSVRRSVSQPLAASPSQSAVSGSVQALTKQVPVAQVGSPLATWHCAVQEPQCSSVCKLVSHPLTAFPSQSAKPVSQAATAQSPVEQVAVACSSEQVVPQAAQLSRVVSGVSQALAGRESQLPQPVVQGPRAQPPLLQTDPAWSYGAQAEHVAATQPYCGSSNRAQLALQSLSGGKHGTSGWAGTSGAVSSAIGSWLTSAG